MVVLWSLYNIITFVRFNCGTGCDSALHRECDEYYCNKCIVKVYDYIYYSVFVLVINHILLLIILFVLIILNTDYIPFVIVVRINGINIGMMLSVHVCLWI